jgi:FKBP-type peptidyl-prolyl cis-trans isomerase
VVSKRRQRELARQRHQRRQQQLAQRRRQQRRRNAVVATVVAAVLVVSGAAYGIALAVGGNDKSSASPSPSASSQPTPIQTPAALKTKPTIAVPKEKAPTKLVTKDLVPGTGAVVKSGQQLVVNYVGVLYTNGKEFDSSWKSKTTFPVTIGQGQVIPGWDQGIPGMKVGGRRELIIPPDLAYGASGQPPTIPPNSTLIFVVDVLSAT